MSPEKVNQQIFRDLIEQVDEAIYIVNVHTGQIMDCNRKACELVQRTREKTLGMKISNIKGALPPGDSWEKHVEDVRNQGNTVMESIVIRDDGSSIPISVKVQIIALEECEYMTAIVRDISERKKKEEELLGNKRKFDAIFDDPSLFVGVLDVDGTLIDANKASIELVGVSESDVINKKFWDTPWWTHSEGMQKRLKESVRKASEGGYDNFEATHIDKNGLMIMVHFSIRSVKNEENKVVSLVCSGIDVSEHQKAERRILHLNRILKALRGINQLITREKDAEKLISDSCRYLVESGGYKNAWISLFDEKIGFKAFADANVNKNFQEIIKTQEEGRRTKCQEMAIKERGMVVARNVSDTCEGCFMKEIHEGMTVFSAPIKIKGKTSGTITVALASSIANDEEEQSLFKEMADDISYALSVIKIEEEQKSMEKEKEKHVHELEVFYESAMGREERILDLKKETESLKTEIRKLKSEW